MMTGEMTDAEVAAQIERADRFMENLRELIASTVLILPAPAPINSIAGLSGSRRPSIRCRS